MATLYKRGKVWYVIYNLNGKQHWRAIGKSKRIAGLALKDIEVKLAKNSAGFFTEDRKLSVCFPEFLSHVAVHTKTTTTRRYTQIISHFQKFLQDQDPPPVNLSQIKLRSDPFSGKPTGALLNLSIRFFFASSSLAGRLI